jgi:predicted nucleotidyltransferase
MTEQFKTTLIATLHQFLLKRAAQFGSFARAKETTDSAIDILRTRKRFHLV